MCCCLLAALFVLLHLLCPLSFIPAHSDHTPPLEDCPACWEILGTWKLCLPVTCLPPPKPYRPARAGLTFMTANPSPHEVTAVSRGVRTVL